MNQKRIVITGLGVISPNGIGKDAFFKAIFAGASGIKPISLFDTSIFKVRTAGEVRDFAPEEFLGPKGLRTLDRCIKLVLSAAKLALDDARIEVTEENSLRIGVAIGTALASVKSVCDFDRDALVDGVRYVNPALFPNTVINSAASQVSIRFNIKGFNSTISTGFSCGLDSVNYAVDLLKLGRCETVLTGAVEELSAQTFFGFYKAGCLAGCNGSGLELSCPFDKRRNGIILGEGSCVLAVEDLESALQRKAHIYAQILGSGTCFDKDLKGVARTMRLALEDAHIPESDIDYICCAANSTVDIDLAETEAIKEVFGSRADKIPVSSIKSMIGESYAASGAFQLAAAVAAIDKQMIPPTINYQEKDPRCDLNHVANLAKASSVKKVLINAFGIDGYSSSMVISAYG